MLLPLSWLREFVPYEGTAEALGERLTMLGLELEGLEHPYEQIAPIVVGHVVECSKHPEADKLSVTRVDVGDEILDIVCGAPNIAQGQKVPVAKIGVTLPGGLTIKKAKLRGQPSHGMICSEAELGLSDGHDGIMVLSPDTPVGKSILDVLPLEKDVLEIGITPNRGDCLSILGFAREVSAAYNLPLTMPSFTLEESNLAVEQAVSVDIQAPELAPLYFGRVIDGVKVQKSAMDVRFRLHSVGVRSISNIVDVTNYVLMELGQPMHAFDLGTVKDRTIIVRSARAGEKFTSLDEQGRVLEAGDIVIADPEKVIGLGGIIGGANSEITETSSQVFLECATFAPYQIRRTKRRLGINSEAAFRFERGVDQTLARYVLDRASSLLVSSCGGTIAKGVAGAESTPWKAPIITLSRQRSEQLLGVELTDEFCEQTLTSLGCEMKKGEQGEWSVTPPCRPDLTREADLIEELARVYGVDKIPATLPMISRLLERSGQAEPLHAFLLRVKQWGASAGLNEVINYSFTSHKILDTMGIAKAGRIELENPLSEDIAVLRPVLAPRLFSAMSTSLAHGAFGVRIFEVASVFHKSATSETTVDEPQRLGILLQGARHDRVWPNTKGDLEYVDIKGAVEHLFTTFDIDGVTYSLSENASSYLSPSVDILHDGVILGTMGKATSDVASFFDARKDVWYAEIDLNLVHTKVLAATRRFAPLTVFPPVRRDITFAVPFGMTSEHVANAVLSLSIPILEDVFLIDSYEPEGKSERNLTFRLTFRHKERTLKESEADKQRENVASQVCKKLNITV